MKMPVDIKQLDALVDWMEARDLAEIELRQDDDSIRLVRRQPGDVTMPGAAVSPENATPTAPAAAGHTVTAPMVGTFYQASSPDAPAFVNVGTEVREGDPLCIIESMKMMNHVRADRAGRVAAILVANGDAVSYDQPLFTLA